MNENDDIAANQDGKSTISEKTQDRPQDQPDPEVLRLLRSLAAHCRDSEAGYRLAYENAEERGLRVEFGRLVDEREEMTRELDRVFQELGQEAPGSGTVLGAAHRVFLGLKAAIAGRDRDEIIDEIVRGENVFEATYDALLRRELPSAVEATIREQHQKVRDTRNHFRAQQSPAPKREARHGAGMVQMVERNPTLSCAVLAAAAAGFALALWLGRQPPHRGSRIRW